MVNAPDHTQRPAAWQQLCYKNVAGTGARRRRACAAGTLAWLPRLGPLRGIRALPAAAKSLGEEDGRDAALAVDSVKFCIRALLPPGADGQNNASVLKECGTIRTAWDLEKLVCEKLNLVIEHVWSDDDLDKLIKRYVDESDFVFAYLKKDLDESTFATLIRRRSINPKAEDRYVAIIRRLNSGA